MPYKSDAQRRYMHARHPEIARRWDNEIRSQRRKGKHKPKGKVKRKVSSKRVVSKRAKLPLPSTKVGPFPAGKIKRASRAIGNRIANKWSTPAARRAQDEFQTPHFGQKPLNKPEGSTATAEQKMGNVQQGLIAGGLGGAVAGGALVGSQTRSDSRALEQHRINTVAYKKKQGIKKSRVHLITDLGTAAGRAENKTFRPGFSGKHLASGAAAGVGATLGVDALYQRGQRKQLKQLYAKQKKPISKLQEPYLERKKLSGKEYAKDRARHTGEYALTGAATYAGGRAASNAAKNAQYKRYNMPGLKVKTLKGVGNKKALGIASAIGAGAGLASYRSRTQYKAVNPNKKKVSKMNNMSAFGVDHGGISKANYGDQPEPSTGRKAAGTLLGGWHSAVAGKKGRKLGAVGSSVGHAIVGSAAGQTGGALLGAALTRGKSAGAMHAGSAVGGLGGGYAGARRAVTTNTRKGRYKPEA